MAEDDLDYFERRAEMELEIAQNCEMREVMAVHYALAELYLERVEALRGARDGAAPTGRIDQ